MFLFFKTNFFVLKKKRISIFTEELLLASSGQSTVVYTSKYRVTLFHQWLSSYRHDFSVSTDVKKKNKKNSSKDFPQ